MSRLPTGARVALDVRLCPNPALLCSSNYAPAEDLFHRVAEKAQPHDEIFIMTFHGTEFRAARWWSAVGDAVEMMRKNGYRTQQMVLRVPSGFKRWAIAHLRCLVKRVDAGPITCDASVCSSEREDPLIRQLRSYPPVPYYPPGYQQRRWKPETISMLSLWQVAKAMCVLKDKLSQLTQDHLLANALVEGRFDHGTGRSHTRFAFGVVVVDDVVSERLCQVTGDPTLNWRHDTLDNTDFFPETSNEALLAGLRYALTFDHKTGAYADAVHHGSATRDQRLALWNGRGKAHRTDPSGKRTLYADAGNHRDKVNAMLKVLNHRDNPTLMSCWETLLEGRLPSLP